jgi:hypothetical protein
MDAIREETIRSVTDLLSFVQDCCTYDDVLFRGQSGDYPLLPKVARIELRRRAAERIIDVERCLLDEFKRRAFPWLEHRPEHDWDWLAVAQHHRLATRLLDWTENPLAALWFAVEQPPAGDRPGVLWVLNAQGFPTLSPLPDDPFGIPQVIIIRPKHIAQRIVSQGAAFTAHLIPPEDTVVVPLESDPVVRPRLTKIIVPADCFQHVRYYLDRCGVNAASIYPGLDGLCQHIEWLHSYQSDEEHTLN